MGVQMRIIGDELVSQVITLEEVITLIEGAFAADARGQNRNFPVVRERLPEPSTGIFGIKSGLAGGDLLGLKAGGFWTGNRAIGVPPHQSTMLLFDPNTGRPTALVIANQITGLRTGAAGAVAASWLARPESRTVGLIGSGAQGEMQLRALACRFPLERARVTDANHDAAAALAERLTRELNFPVEAVADGALAVDGADIVITATPGFGPVLHDSWVTAGQHVNAVGSDTAGKQEVETDLVARAKLVVDNRVQAAALGETQHLPKVGVDPAGHIHAELGEVIGGARPGRESTDEITLFDATGVTFQDLVVAGEIVRRCEEQDLGMTLEV